MAHPLSFPNDACIIILPKSGKNLLVPESYRPISLLNSDVKILARILATRLSKVMQGVVPSGPIQLYPH